MVLLRACGRAHGDEPHRIEKNGLVFTLSLVSFAMSWMPLLLLFFHTSVHARCSRLTCRSYLALTNQTTYETLKRPKIPWFDGLPEDLFPFDKGGRWRAPELTW